MRFTWKRALLAAIAGLGLAMSGVAFARPDHGGGHPGRGHGKGGGNACDTEAVASIRAAAEAACPCDGVDDGERGVTPWRNHGRYVRCVARAVRDGLRAAGLERRCLRDVVPCAARSTCGKREAVACVTTTASPCTGGLCADDPETACVVDADCAVRACRVTRPERCAAAGGVAATGSCCTASVSGAFVDPPLSF